MRILHVLEAIEAGVARHVTDVVRNVPGDHDVLLPPERIGGFTDQAAFAAMELAGAQLHLAPMRRSPHDRRNAAAAVAARRLLRRHHHDVIHGHASIGGAVARLAAAGTGAARVYTPNALMPGWGAAAAERALGRVTDALVAVSETEAELIAAMRIVPRRRLFVIRNGIDLAPPERPEVGLRARLGLGDREPLIGSVGRLTPQKAPDVFIRACVDIGKRCTGARFVLIGDGPLRARVPRWVEHGGLVDRFTHIPGMQEAARVLGELDAFALSSRYEAAPYAPLEAMRAGVPVVLTDVVGNRDTVVDGDSGLLVPPDDPGQLAAALCRVLLDSPLRHRLVAGATARLASCFDVQAMAGQLSDLYEKVARDRRLRARLRLSGGGPAKEREQPLRL